MSGRCPSPEPAPTPPARTNPDAAPTVALVGRPNAGKSSLYNRLTGGDAKVGNFPGITVEILQAEVHHRGARALTVVDLPGLYSLGMPPDGETDEGVARTWLDQASASGAPLVVVQVLDGTQLALGLRLTRELLEEPFPLLVAVTQYDLVQRDGRALDTARLSSVLGVPVLAVSAREPSTRDKVLDAAVAQLSPPEGASELRRPSPEWDPDALAREVTRHTQEGRAPRRALTERLDGVLLHPVLGALVFLGLMAALFAAVFLVADPVSSVLDAGLHRVAGFVGPRVSQPMVRSFLLDGILGGAGTVLAFLPQIVILTVAMELLDASGYLARGVFLVDRLFRAVGLGGRAFVPLLTAHACAVPAITATRILRDPRERLTALLVLPLMTCSARIPTYGLLVAMFLGGRSVWVRAGVFVGLYFLGMTFGLVAAAVLRKSVTRGRSLPLVVEMPAYRAPEPRAMALVGWRASVRFLKDVGTTILLASVVLWALLTVPAPGASPPHGAAQDDSPAIQRSIAAGLGRALEPATRLAGFDWRINVGLMASFGARELMVGTLGVIYGLEDADEESAPLAARLRAARAPDGSPLYGLPTALSLMAFFVFACQCMSTVAALRRETRGWRWPLFVLGYTYALGAAAAVAVFQVSRAILPG